MPDTLDPILCPCNIPGVITAQYVIKTLPNVTNIQALRIENKGPYDIKFSGVGILGTEWIPAGMSICYRTNQSNQGQITFIAYSSNANSNSQFYDTASYSTILITTYQIDEDVDYSRYHIPINGPSLEVANINAPACQGTTVTVPNSVTGPLPFTNNGFCFLLGFDFTMASAAAAASGNLVVQGLYAGQSGSANMTYRIHSNVDPTPLVIMSIRYPRPGIPNAVGSNIQFVVPTVSNATMNLVVFYTWNI